MIRKQRLALAISAALSIAGGAGCSTITGIKATPASTDGNVVVHYVSFSGSRQYLQSELVDSSRTKDLIKSIQLDTEIDVLAEKLGLGKFFENKPKIQKKAPARIQKRIRPQIKRATYNNKKIQQRKVVMRKALATRRKISIANRQLVVTRQVAKRDFSKSTNLITLEREVNRLYLGKKSGRNVQQISRNSLWTRITRGYRLSSDNEQRVVQKILSRHAGNPDNLNRIFEHSGKYLHFIFYELKKRGMPTELALLPMVESTYNNDFKSKSGAVGLWQFRANEGRQLGLRQTSVYDARLDVYASTHAALNKLQSLNHRFKGDWVLTLAAYKEGVKKVQREMIRNRYLGKPVNFWDLNLSKQTQYYVAELLAYREILLRPHAYNLTLPVATTSPKIMQIVVNKVVNLRRASLAANLPVSMLEELNRNFKNGITNPHLSKKIILPRHYARKLQRSIRQQSPVITASYKTQNKTKRYTMVKKAKPVIHLLNYQIKKGESLYKIALRHGMTITNIMRLNGMYNTRIKAGKSLKVALQTTAKRPS